MLYVGASCGRSTRAFCAYVPFVPVRSAAKRCSCYENSARVYAGYVRHIRSM